MALSTPWARLPFPVRVFLVLVLSWFGGLLLFRTLLDSKLEHDRLAQAARILSGNIQLTELALERYPPEALASLQGDALLVSHDPPDLTAGGPSDDRLQAQARALDGRLCQVLGRCHTVLPAWRPQRGLWIRLQSPLEPVWMFFPLPLQGLFSPDPLVLTPALLSGGVLALALLLLLEVQRPIRRLGRAMAQVGTDGVEALPPLGGAPDVRCLEEHFNAMLRRLQALDRERQTMLAGIAHDFNSPLTRLRLRLAGEAPLHLDAECLLKVGRDLTALERITRQFLLFAGSGSREPFVLVPLDVLITEQTARYNDGLLHLNLASFEACVQPVAIGRALTNLIDNALTHGAAPVDVQLELLPARRFRLVVMDQGPGIPEALLAQALEPFRRLDPARRGEGHTGLGLAIVQRIARQHGGQLVLGRAPGGGLAAAIEACLQPAGALVSPPASPEEP